MTCVYKFVPSITITGDISTTPQLGSHAFQDLDVSDYGTYVIPNDSSKVHLDLGNADYYSVIYLQTNNPISVYVNSSTGTPVVCQSVMMLTGGIDDITDVWLKNAGTSLATVKLAYGGKLDL